ncbi:MAG: hypothetical protein AAF492_11770 [Verrucomicrobiota bacterium]
MTLGFRPNPPGDDGETASEARPFNLTLKAGAVVVPAPSEAGDIPGFLFSYPNGIPHAASPSPPEPDHAITLSLTGSENAGVFSFSGAKPFGPFYYLLDVTLDPLDYTASHQRITNTAFSLVPTGLPFPPYTLRILST